MDPIGVTVLYDRRELQRPRVNVAQAITIAGVHRNTIYNWVRLNKVEYVRTPTGALRIYVDTLLKQEPA
jgi:predicted site-specific integrase-resolvase